MTPVNRRSFLRTFAQAAAAGTAASMATGLTLPSSVAAQTNNNRPNVLLFTADDLGIKLGTYGYQQVISPNIDAFAQESLVFEKFYCQVAVCTAARTSFLIGQRPSTSGLYGLTDQWNTTSTVESMPQAFKKSGYYTYSCGKIWDPRAGQGINLGWDVREHEWEIRNSDPAKIALSRCAQQGKPWFLCLGTRQPHCPWTPTQESLNQYDASSITADGPGRTITAGHLPECSGIGKANLTDADANDITLRYLASVTDVDRIFKETIDELKRLGQYDNTIILFTSADHGYHLGENDHWGKWNNHDAATHIPLLMRVPGAQVNGQRTKAMTELVDLYPTFVELCGLQNPIHELEGFSMAALFSNPTQPWKKAAYSQWADNVNDISVKTEKYNYMVRYGEKKLYDLDNDPLETNNLASSKPDIVAQMEQLLADGWRQAKPDDPVRTTGTSAQDLQNQPMIAQGKLLHLNSFNGQMPMKVTVLDLRGRETAIFNVQGSQKAHTLSLAKLSSGSYVVSATSGSKKIQSKVFIP